MKNKFTNNLWLKIASIVAAVMLWLIVVNVDDPVINRTYSGISVELLNEDAVSDEGQCYEVLGGTDTISVVVSAKRSVLDDMSRDYIRATADMRDISLRGTIPIEIKVTRFGDAIESISSRTENVQLKLENVVEKTIPLMVHPEGEVESGYLLSSVTPKKEEVVIKGPESEVNEVSHAECSVPIDGLKADETKMVPVILYDNDNNEYSDARVTQDVSDMSVNIVIWATKRIPVAFQPTGTPADGYSATGNVTISPESVVITGRSAYLSSMTSIVVPSDSVSISGATANVSQEVDLKKYLPDGISFVDEDEYDGSAVITVEIEANDRKLVNVPLSNITVDNLPEGYKAVIVDVGESIQIEIQGKGDTFNRFDGSFALGSIDALSLSPRNAVTDEETIHTGANDGLVKFSFPTGVYEVSPLYLEVIIERVEEETEQ